MGNEKTIRVTKSQLRRMIREGIQQLSEGPYTPAAMRKIARDRRAQAATEKDPQKVKELEDWAKWHDDLAVDYVQRAAEDVALRNSDYMNPPKYKGRLVQPGDIYLVQDEEHHRKGVFNVRIVDSVDDASKRKRQGVYLVRSHGYHVNLPTDYDYRVYGEPDAETPNTYTFREFEEHLEYINAKLISQATFEKLKLAALRRLTGD